MNTRIIPEEQWTAFFDRFSRDHVAWPTTIEAIDRGDAAAGRRTVARDLPLEGVSFDTKGTRTCAVEVSVADASGRHVNHVMDLPLYIREASGPDGIVDLQIECAEGPVTLMHLRPPGGER